MTKTQKTKFDELIEQGTIVITVEGGMIQDISGIPKGLKIQVWDFDADCIEDENDLEKTESGDEYILSEYVGK